jgi:hypothetical protein
MLIILSQITDNTDYEKFAIFPNILIYNKSNMVIDNNINSITIPKKGYHAYSLYHYIYTNYENLTEDYYIFISLYTELYDENSFPSQEFLNNIWYYIENEKTMDIYFKSLDEFFLYKNTETIINTEDEDTCNLDHQHIQSQFKKCYTELFSSFESLKYKYTEGFNYIISKNAILSRSRDFYLNILNYLDTYDENCFYEKIFIEILTDKIFTDNFNTDCCSSSCSSECSSDCSSDTSSEDDEFNSPNICFKPPLNYCDYCNKLDIVKPINPIMAFCSENCKQQYNSSTDTPL